MSKEITPQISAAIKHVSEYCPSLSIIVFDRNGKWLYMDEDFNAFSFDENIDVSILEAAADSLTETPAIFQIN